MSKPKLTTYAVQVEYIDTLSGKHVQKWFYCAVKDGGEIPLKIEAIVGAVFEILIIEKV